MTSRVRMAIRIDAAAKGDIGQHQRYAEQEQLARAPYARRKCHES